MLAVPVARRPGEHGHQDLRAEAAHHVEHVLEDRVAGPEPQRFVQRLGISEVVGAGEELAGGRAPPGAGRAFPAGGPPPRGAPLAQVGLRPPPPPLRDTWATRAPTPRLTGATR